MGAGGAGGDPPPDPQQIEKMIKQAAQKMAAHAGPQAFPLPKGPLKPPPGKAGSSHDGATLPTVPENRPFPHVAWADDGDAEIDWDDESDGDYRWART